MGAGSAAPTGPVAATSGPGGVRQRVEALVQAPVPGPVPTEAHCEVVRIVARLRAATASRPPAAPLSTAVRGLLRPRDAHAAAATRETARGAGAQPQRPQQSNSAWPLCAAAVAHPAAGMPRHCGELRRRRGAVCVSAPALGVFGAGAALRVFASPRPRPPRAARAGRRLGEYACCCVDFRAVYLRGPMLRAWTRTATCLPAPRCDAESKVTDAHGDSWRRAAGRRPAADAALARRGAAGTARRAGAWCDACDERAQLRDRDGVPYRAAHGRHLAGDAAAHGQPMGMARFAGTRRRARRFLNKEFKNSRRHKPSLDSACGEYQPPPLTRRLAATNHPSAFLRYGGRWFDSTLLNHGQSEVLA